MLTRMIYKDEKWMVSGYDAIREAHKTAGCQQGKNCDGPGCKVKRVRGRKQQPPQPKLRRRDNWAF